jgi:hypothetical protein
MDGTFSFSVSAPLTAGATSSLRTSGVTRLTIRAPAARSAAAGRMGR